MRGLIGSAVALVLNSYDDSIDRGWSQKTAYVPPKPDHERHIKAAEAKRERKRLKLMGGAK